MSGKKETPAEARAKVTRRVVLAVGGVSLLAFWHPELGGSKPASDEAAVRPSPHPSASVRLDGTKKPAARPVPEHWHRTGRAPTGHEPVYYVNDGRKGIALTIDDGPSPVYTPQILQLLATYKVNATFSMIGTEVDAYPQIAREVHDAGHVIANHTWTHIDLVGLKQKPLTEQFDRATDAIHKATGRTPSLFRAPYGAWSKAVLRECERTKMTPIDWSVDPRDWARPGVSSIVRNIMANTRGGSIILEHDGGGNRTQTVAALKIVLPRLLDAGYQFYPL